MSKLRQQLIQELVLRGCSPRTQEAYVSAVYHLAKYYRRSPDQISDPEVRTYLLYLAQTKKLAASSRNQATSALRFFYATVLGRPVDQVVRVLPRVRQAVRRPQVFAISELERLFTLGCPHPRDRAFLMTVYGAGLRLNEACHLKPEHIDSERRQIRVVQGKGKKDRYTLLSPRLLEELRRYWKCCRPKEWLFPSSADPAQPMVDVTAQRIFNRAVERARLPDKGGIHSLRQNAACREMPSWITNLADYLRNSPVFDSSARHFPSVTSLCLCTSQRKERTLNDRSFVYYRSQPSTISIWTTGVIGGHRWIAEGAT